MAMNWRSEGLGILLMFLLLGALPLNPESYVAGHHTPKDPTNPTKVIILVSNNVALHLAEKELNSIPFEDFKGAKVGKKLVLFYFPDGRPAYYEVPLLRGGKLIGVMFIPASKTMPPEWMQVFKSRELISKQLDGIAKRRGFKHYRYVVLGAAVFGIQTDGGVVVDLAGREYKINPRAPFRFSIESERNVVLWAKFEKSLLGGSSRKIISGVPTWTSTDSGNADTRYPNNVGSVPDPWDNWDGCSPIAASMVVAYYDSQFRTAPMKEAIIDILHFTMKTDSKGGTKPGNIPKGIEDFYWEAMNLYKNGYLVIRMGILSSTQPTAMTLRITGTPRIINCF
ncbi:hypothetical protein [Thermococcus sp.]|uniref:hypothetical protein n=1 Tax=Thermococcus sp. TaxID=35749 RepID=UPI0026293B57|nr:hypothetical protein [Thermococcus sp.]